jgi:hypothetical protein
MTGGGALPGSPGGAQPERPEATGAADGGQWGRLSNMAMEAK